MTEQPGFPVHCSRPLQHVQNKHQSCDAPVEIHSADVIISPSHQNGMTDRVVSALQPLWLIGLGRARTRDQPVSRRKGYPDRFRGSPPRSSVDAMPDLIVLFLPCQVVGDVTPTPCAPPSKGRPLAPAEAYPAARGVRRQGVGHRQQANEARPHVSYISEDVSHLL